MKTRILECLFLGGVCSVLLSGCGGGKLGEVEGTVTLNGKPLSGAEVVFQPDHEGRPSSGITDEEGHYVLQYTANQAGAEVGVHTVRIRAEVTRKDRFGEEVTVGDRVPTRYNEESELKKEVTSGDQEINLELESNGKIYAPGDTGTEAIDTCE